MAANQWPMPATNDGNQPMTMANQPMIMTNDGVLMCDQPMTSQWPPTPTQWPANDQYWPTSNNWPTMTADGPWPANDLDRDWPALTVTGIDIDPASLAIDVTNQWPWRADDLIELTNIDDPWPYWPNHIGQWPCANVTCDWCHDPYCYYWCQRCDPLMTVLPMTRRQTRPVTRLLMTHWPMAMTLTANDCGWWPIDDYWPTMTNDVPWPVLTYWWQH